MARSKYPFELKLKIFHLLNQGHYSISEPSKQYEVSPETIKLGKASLKEMAKKDYALGVVVQKEKLN